MNNEVKVQGKLKNVRVMTTKSGDKFVTGWFDQREISAFGDGRHDREVYVFGINFISFDAESVALAEALDNARQGADQTSLVHITGRLTTRFDRRLGIKESERRAPQLQLTVDEMQIDLPYVFNELVNN